MRGRYSSMFQLRKSGLSQMLIHPPKSARGVAVIAAEALCQICGFEAYFSFGDAADAQFFHENVRSEQDCAAQAILSSGINDRDGGAIAVADEDWVLDMQNR